MNQAQADLLLQKLFDEWYGSLVRYGLRLTRDRAVVEESVQQGMWLLYRELRAGNDIPNPKAWTLLVVKREIWRSLRKQKGQHPIEPNMLVVEGEACVQEAASELDLADFLVLLSERETEVILLRLESMKYQEIADTLGISPNSVNRFLARALAKIRNHCLGTGARSNPAKSHAAKGTR